MTHIEFTEDKPDIYNSSGVHLFAGKPKYINGLKKLIINKNAPQIDLYKLHNDVAIFLSNTVYPSPNKDDIRTFPIFGNPKHKEFLKINLNEINFSKNIKLLLEQGLSDSETYLNQNGFSNFIGYLDTKDVKEVYDFFQSNSFYEKKNIQKYFEALNDDVKQELEMLLDNDVIAELYNQYLKPMVVFFRDCLATENEVVIIENV